MYHNDTSGIQQKGWPVEIKSEVGSVEVQPCKGQKKTRRKQRKIEEGKAYGRLTVLHFQAGSHNIFKCECGAEKPIRSAHVLAGLIKSCGCLMKEVTSKRMTTHGLSRTKEFRAWAHMKNRCLNKDDPVYPYYGGRGITFCDRWQNFLSFYEDMGLAPSPKHSVDRINTNGNYEPSNCRWSTQEDQCNNQRRNHFLECFGERLTLSQWSKKTGIPYCALKVRINTLKWDANKALTHPLRKLKPRKQIDPTVKLN